MNAWLKRIGTTLGLLILIVVLAGVMLPTEYRVHRSVVIQAKPGPIHEFVGDLTKWEVWSPWIEEDPSLVVTVGDKTSGVGASQSWVGKDGDGSLTFTKSSPTEGIEYDLFFEQGTYQCWAAMTYSVINENTTKVLWRMKGDMNTPIIGGYFALLMDSMVGGMFERGLEKLKEQVEKV